MASCSIFETSTPQHKHKNQTNNHKKRWNDVGNYHLLLRPLVLVWAAEILRIQMILLLLLLLYCLCWRNDRRRLHIMRIDDCKNQQSKSNDLLHYYMSSRDPNASNQFVVNTEICCWYFCSCVYRPMFTWVQWTFINDIYSFHQQQ